MKSDMYNLDGFFVGGEIGALILGCLMLRLIYDSEGLWQIDNL